MFKKEFKKRILSGLILLPLTIYIINLGGISFIIFLAIFAGFMLSEVKNILNNSSVKNNNISWQITGFVYILFAVLSLYMLRNLHDGFYLTIWLCAIIWSTDSMALLFGKKFKGPKLAYNISPNKTWSGFVGGILGAMIISVLFQQTRSGIYSIKMMLIIGVLVSIVGQIGDLLESFFKRKFDVKDSGDIIPGHGGVLDRCDSLLLAAPFMFILFYFLPRILNVSAT